MKKSKSLFQNERAVSIDTAKYKRAKNNYSVIKYYLQGNLKINKVTRS